ncbi:hypothetical protein D3C87_1589160 [compost metagenome]
MPSKIGFEFFPFVKDYHQLLFWGLMVTQLTIACLLLFDRTRLYGLYTAFFLLITLSTYIYMMLNYSEQIPCSCTGIIPGLSWKGHLWFTVGTVILSGFAIGLLPVTKKYVH